jgi:nitrile hydratase accessory protein
MTVTGDSDRAARPDGLAPTRPVFAEPWHAQVLALAQEMVAKGCFSARQWADALGSALREAEAGGAPDTDDTYYTAVLCALETLSSAETGISPAELAERRRAWREAYESTPHGQPVELRPRT